MSPDLAARPDHDTPAYRHARAQATALLSDFERERQQQPTSFRYFADQHDIPKSTLHFWKTRKDALDADPHLVAFLESPAGLHLLQTLLLAAHFVFHALGHAGVRPIARFFELSGLTPFLANSYGAHQQFATELLDQILAYEAEQRPELAKQMPQRSISVCEDETFPHAGICLVAIEPVSGFVLAEQIEQHRDAATWDVVLTQATTDLNVDLRQQTSDEASALLCHAKHRDVHHSPDLFHILRALNLGTVLALLRQSQAARQDVEDAEAELLQQQDAFAAWQARFQRTGRPLDFASRITAAQARFEQAKAWHEQTHGAQLTRQAAIAGISADYHPFDLTTGAPRSAAEVETALNGHVHRLREMAEAQGLGGSSREGIEKGARQIGPMVGTIRFFWSEVNQRVEGAELSAAHERLLRDTLLPAAYLHRVAARSSKAEARTSVRAQATALLAAGKEALGQLSAEEGPRLEALAWDCADIFQRSSSCVEGRNGQLALNEHVRRGLSPRRLKALTVLHNYAITGPDGTTAAERFFGQAPADLFTWLRSRMPAPARPALKRPKTKKVTLLEAV